MNLLDLIEASTTRGLFIDSVVISAPSECVLCGNTVLADGELWILRSGDEVIQTTCAECPELLRVER